MNAALHVEALRAHYSNIKDAIFLSAARLGASSDDKPATVSPLCYHSPVASGVSPEAKR
jgi:hypothetical protein